MKRREKKAVQRMLANWRSFNSKINDIKAAKIYSEGYFMGCWSVINDKQASYLLSLLSREEYNLIMRYPLWM